MRRRLVLLTLDEVDSVLHEVGVEVLDLLLRQLDVLETVDDLVVGEKALLFSICDELVELLDVRERDIDGEHVSEPPGLVVARRHCYNRPRPAAAAAVSRSSLNREPDTSHGLRFRKEVVNKR